MVQKRADRMREILERELAPSSLMIFDESARHHGHMEMKSALQHNRGPQHAHDETPHLETHYKIEITSQKFLNMKALERHRFVHMLLKKEFSSGLHALSLRLKTEEEA